MSHFFLLKIAVPNSVTGKSKLTENVKTKTPLDKRADVTIPQMVNGYDRYINVLGYITSYQIFIF